LAGAADDVLGKRVDEQPSALASIKHALAAKGFGAPDDVGTFMNMTRNFLKHHKGDDLPISESELESEAIQMISRAVINYLRAGHVPLPEHLAFFEWARSRRPDLFISDR
jgi:hypothetical protein